LKIGRKRFVLVCLACAALFSVGPLLAASPPPGKFTPSSPLSAGESLAHFQLEPGLRIEIAAAEPEVIDPVAVAFDPDGRMWVVEMTDYPRGPKPGEEPKSRIRILEDPDGDGRYDVSRVFADKLLFATGVLPSRQRRRHARRPRGLDATPATYGAAWTSVCGFAEKFAVGPITRPSHRQSHLHRQWAAATM
jgi:hypothetical protein